MKVLQILPTHPAKCMNLFTDPQLRSCPGSRLIIPLRVPGDTFRLLWDGGSLIYRIIYTPQVPHRSPLASEASLWLSAQTAEEAAGGRGGMCV